LVEKSTIYVGRALNCCKVPQVRCAKGFATHTLFFLVAADINVQNQAGTALAKGDEGCFHLSCGVVTLVIWECI